ncbi:MAG: hypothetical protein V9E83_02385 [Baekduia sp.]
METAQETAEVEVVDAEPVPSGVPTAVGDAPRTVTLRLPRGFALVLPARVAQGAALALTGFTAGALTTVLGRRGGGRKLLRKPGSKVSGRVVGTRSFVVDVHLLDKR